MNGAVRMSAVRACGARACVQAIVLSQRAAITLARWELGKWAACPNRVLRDTHSAATDARMRRTCVVKQTSTYAEDLYTGIVMAQAKMRPMRHACMLALEAGELLPLPPSDGGVDATDVSVREELQAALLRRLARCHDGCPISVHPLKTNRSMWNVRTAVSDCPRTRHGKPITASGTTTQQQQQL